MTDGATAAAYAVALVLVASALAKTWYPASVEPLVAAAARRHLRGQLIAYPIAAAEFVTAVGIFLDLEWAWALGILLVAAFTAVLVLAIRRSEEAPSCGCLGDLLEAPVSPFHVFRNVVLLALLAASWSSADGPSLAVVPAAAPAAALLLLAPEAVVLVRDLRGTRQREISVNRATEARSVV